MIEDICDNRSESKMIFFALFKFCTLGPNLNALPPKCAETTLAQSVSLVPCQENRDGWLENELTVGQLVRRRRLLRKNKQGRLHCPYAMLLTRKTIRNLSLISIVLSRFSAKKLFLINRKFMQ